MGLNSASLLDDIRTTHKSLTLSSEAVTQVHASFASHATSLLSLTEQLEIKLKEIETRESAVGVREKNAQEKDQQLQEREKKCAQREQGLNEREKYVVAREDKWNSIEIQMQQNASKLPSVIHINVSGTRFTASKEKLLQCKGSLFEQMLVSNHAQQLSSGELFIERDPKYFHHIVRFLLNGSVKPPKNPHARQAIELEFANFNIPFKFPVCSFLHRPTVAHLVDDSAFGENIKEWLPNKTFQLLFKAAVDGFTAAAFHKLCDNKGPTLTVIRSDNGYLFGGYSVLPWDNTTSNHKQHPEGFVFTLTNPHNIPPTKYSRNSHPYSIYCHVNRGPTFGGGHDIYVGDNFIQPDNNYTNFPTSYADTTGKGNNTFTGAYNFVPSDIEVFSVL